MQVVGAHGCEVMYFWCFCFRGFLDCDDICMYVVNKNFELLFLIPFMLTVSIMHFFSLLLLGLCACVVYVIM